MLRASVFPAEGFSRPGNSPHTFVMSSSFTGNTISSQSLTNVKRARNRLTIISTCWTWRHGAAPSLWVSLPPLLIRWSDCTATFKHYLQSHLVLNMLRQNTSERKVKFVTTFHRFLLIFHCFSVLTSFFDWLIGFNLLDVGMLLISVCVHH